MGGLHIRCCYVLVNGRVRSLRVSVLEVDGNIAVDEVRVLIGSGRSSRERADPDQDNALEGWTAHGLLETCLETRLGTCLGTSLDLTRTEESG